MKFLVFLAQLAFGVVLIGGWEIASRVGAISPQLLPPPSIVAATLGELLISNAFLGECYDTVVRVIAVFLIGAPIALVVGFVMGEKIEIGKTLVLILNLVLAVPQSIFLSASQEDFVLDPFSVQQRFLASALARIRAMTRPRARVMPC